MAHISSHHYQGQYQCPRRDTAAFGFLRRHCCLGICQMPKPQQFHQYPWKSDAIHEFSRKLLFPGRGDWLVESEKFGKWLVSNSSRTFWLSGKPGSGKSVLTSVVIDKIKSRSSFGDIVAFYCGDRRPGGSNIVVELLKTILLQLQCRPTDSKSREQLYALETDLEYASDSISASKMAYILSIMRHNLKRHETLFLIIDGLEEASHSEQGPDPLLHQFLELITAQDTRHRIKCFISSRPGYFSEKQLLGSARLDIDTEPAAQQDIATYVRDEILETPALKKWFQGCRVDSAIESLISEANGVFLWASLQLSYISATVSLSPFPFETSGTFLAISKSSELNSLYERILRAISTDHRGPLFGMLGWVAHAARPLSLKELGCAVHYELDVTNSIIQRHCGGLLITGSDQTVDFVHWTVAEFLSSESSSTLDWNPSPEEWHETIARKCLSALPSSYLLRSLSLPSQSHNQGPLTTPQLSDILQYAFRYWKFHYRLAEEHSKILPGILHNYLKIALEEEEIASKNESEDVEMSTMASHIALNAEVANIALMSASRFGFTSLARLELQMGADSHLIPGMDGNTALHLAAMEGHLDIAKSLVQYGADLNAASKSGNTPLAWSVYCGHYQIVEFLLSSGADVIPKGDLSCLSSRPHSIESPQNDECDRICCACGTTANMTTNIRQCSGYNCKGSGSNCDRTYCARQTCSFTEEIAFEAIGSEICSDCEEMQVSYSVSVLLY